MDDTPATRKKAGEAGQSLCASPGLRYAPADEGAMVVRLPGGPVWPLAYPEAAVWDWLQRGRSVTQTVELLATLACVGQHEAQAMMQEYVAKWLVAGLLTGDGADG